MTGTASSPPGEAGVLLVPGLFGSGPGHWQRIWHEERPETRMLDQTDWEHPRLDCWLAALERAIEANDETYIVAHSLGCLLTAHLAARLAGRPAARRIKGAFLVAPCDLARTEALHPGRLTFPDLPAVPLPFPSLTIGSLDDPYMAPGQLDRFRDDLETTLHTIGAAGHINIASGYGRWVQGYALFDAFRAGIERRSGMPGRSGPSAGRTVLPVGPADVGHHRLPSPSISR